MPTVRGIRDFAYRALTKSDFPHLLASALCVIFSQTNAGKSEYRQRSVSIRRNTLILKILYVLECVMPSFNTLCGFIPVFITLYALETSKSMSEYSIKAIRTRNVSTT